MQKTVVNLETGEVETVFLTEEDIAAAEALKEISDAQTAAYVPASVPLWAVRVVLKKNNLFQQAQVAIENSGNESLQILWEYGNYADRNSQSIAALGQALGLNSSQIDDMFREAAALVL